MKTICICTHCASAFPVPFRPNYKYRCPKCNQLLYNSKMQPDEWAKIPNEEKEKYIKNPEAQEENIAAIKKQALEEWEKSEVEKRQAAAEKAAKDAELRVLRQKQRESFLMTTGFSFETHKIVSYLGIKSGEVVLGTGFLSEISASLNDMFGSESNTLSTKLAQAKNSAIDKLIDHCIDVGANAVIGVDLDISTIGQNMIVACANGTAVKVEAL